MSHGLKFLHGTFFEILLSVSCSMAMLKYYAYLNLSDWVSVVLSFLFAVILFSHIMFIVYFTIFKTKEWTMKASGEKLMLLGKAKIKKVHMSIILKKGKSMKDDDP